MPDPGDSTFANDFSVSLHNPVNTNAPFDVYPNDWANTANTDDQAGSQITSGNGYSLDFQDFLASEGGNNTRFSNNKADPLLYSSTDAEFEAIIEGRDSISANQGSQQNFMASGSEIQGTGTSMQSTGFDDTFSDTFDNSGADVDNMSQSPSIDERMTSTGDFFGQVAQQNASDSTAGSGDGTNSSSQAVSSSFQFSDTTRTAITYSAHNKKRRASEPDSEKKSVACMRLRQENLQ